MPARNEADSIERCLTSIDAAAARLGVPVHIVVAADSCTDDTSERAVRHRPARATIEVVEGRWGTAGRARRAGTDRLLAAVADDDGHRWWIASTDADSTVNTTWLVTQLRHARQGALAVAGIVQLDAAAPRRLRAAFAATYALDGLRHHHVHATNLGVRADAYRATPGWRTSAMVGEDHHLWQSLLSAGVPTVQPTDLVVHTSARTAGRVPAGFAANVARLDTRVDPGRSMLARAPA